MFSFSFSSEDLLHGNRLMTGFKISIKILLGKMTFLFWILLCYLPNMSSFCIGSISWCCFVVTLFRCSSHVPLFRGIPLFRQCSGVPPVFWCSASVPCSGVPGFIVPHRKSLALLSWKISPRSQKTSAYQHFKTYLSWSYFNKGKKTKFLCQGKEFVNS